jgi:hypothetical protein
MNDARTDLDVMLTYKEVRKFVVLQRELDPHEFFSKRVGGFKYNVEDSLYRRGPTLEFRR